MIFRVRNPLPGFCHPGFCSPDSAPPVGEWFSESKIRCPDFAPQILPPGLCPPYVKCFPSPKSVAQILPSKFCTPWLSGFLSPKSVARILLPVGECFSESKIRCPDFAPWISPLQLVNASCFRARSFHRCCRARMATSCFFFAMTGTAAADITCELPCTAVSIIFPRPTTLSNASPDVFLSSLHSKLSLCSFVMSVKLLSHLVFCIQRGRKVSTQSRQNYWCNTTSYCHLHTGPSWVKSPSHLSSNSPSKHQRIKLPDFALLVFSSWRIWVVTWERIWEIIRS